MISKSPKFQLVLISAGLVLLILAAFEPLRHNDFISYDDDFYVTSNRYIQSGITRESVAWAFTTGHQANWHPLTWLSHMLDIELFGLNPLGHHLHNLLLHTVSTVLLFWLLHNMTGAVWRSAFVAMAFGIHPLRVESVAWAAERKDVLCALFWMLTIAAYLYYAKRGGINRYLLVVLCFGLGLMAKPMIITLPIVLLILDFWPLGRIRKSADKKQRYGYRPASVWGLAAEKIPLFILTFASCIVTYLVQQHKGSVDSNSLSTHHITNALVSYVGYLGKIFWPVNLAVLYPYSDNGFAWWQPIVFFLVLAVWSGFVIVRFHKQPYLAAGWFWYMVTLVPVIGLVQAGIQAMADRYTYLPSIGIFIILAWSVVEFSAKWRYQKILMGILSGLAAIAMVVGTRTQLTYWKDSITLFKHTLAVTHDNYMIHHNLGWILTKQNKFDEAVEQFNKTLQIQPDFPEANISLAAILIIRNQFDKAMALLQTALKMKPDDAAIHFNMGLIFEARQKFDEAIHAYGQAVRLDRNNSDAFNHLGGLKREKGLLDEAAECFRQSIRIAPAHAEAHYNLAVVLQMQGRIEEAVGCYRQTLQLEPNFIMALNNLAWTLSTSPDSKIQKPAEAVQLARKACELTSLKNFSTLDTLAVAYAAAGRFKEAVETAQKAIDLANAAGQTDLASRIEQRLKLYQAAKPYSEPISPNRPFKQEPPNPNINSN
jgi:tetratricopeptide (TPR) repeat protein